MNDIRYLLSIKELLDDSIKARLLEAAYSKMDQERLRKVQRITNVRKQAESIGAGLLLQLGLQELEFNEKNGITKKREPVQAFTVSQVLAKLGDSVDIKYDYSEKGKPFFRDLPLYFSLSHSGEYVFCVFSEKEIGADIQYRKPNARERMLKRFFTESEQKAWEACATQEEKEKFFYRLWTRKEAYGKLTGEGIVPAVRVETSADVNEDLKVVWADYEILEDYQIAVCKRMEEKE